MARALDAILAALKWPVALATLLVTPGLVYALYRVLRAIAAAPRSSYPFLAGAAVYALVWYLLLRRSRIRFFGTVEHELTHAIFAWATFHRVVGFRASLRGGGHIRFLGKGNWLIALAPYFVPTLSLAVMAALAWLPERTHAAASAALGVTVAYHVFSTWSETHRQQTDLQQAGPLFCVLFLPGANALSFGLVLAFAGGLRLAAWGADVRRPTAAILNWAAALVGG